jgi:hypothetical protein
MKFTEELYEQLTRNLGFRYKIRNVDYVAVTEILKKLYNGRRNITRK